MTSVVTLNPSKLSNNMKVDVPWKKHDQLVGYVYTESSLLFHSMSELHPSLTYTSVMMYEQKHLPCFPSWLQLALHHFRSCIPCIFTYTIRSLLCLLTLTFLDCSLSVYQEINCQSLWSWTEFTTCGSTGWLTCVTDAHTWMNMDKPHWLYTCVLMDLDTSDTED